MNKRIGCIIMAAGDSQRFGKKNKLLEQFAGEAMITRALKAVPLDHVDRCILVASTDEVSSVASGFNIQVVINSKPELGIGRTIKLGTQALGDGYDGYMFVVGDQPLLTTTSVTRLIDFWQTRPDKITALGFGKRSGNPVIFPHTLYNELCQLKDDEYGRVIYVRHQDLFETIPVTDEFELMDIDTIEDFETLKVHFK